MEDSQLPLEQKKRKIIRNLRNLEQAGLATASNKYQDLINEISKVHKQLFFPAKDADPHSVFVKLKCVFDRTSDTKGATDKGGRPSS